MLIALDPGHGGRDSGCRYGPLVESAWTMRVAELLAARLRAAGLDVLLTRAAGEGVSLWRRGWRTRACQAVVSLHVNANPHPELGGLEVYSRDQLPDLALAAQIATRCPASLLRPRREAAPVWSTRDDPATTRDDWLQRPAAVLRWHGAPAVLVECGYATHDADRKYLLRDDGAAAVVAAIAAGVTAWAAGRA